MASFVPRSSRDGFDFDVAVVGGGHVGSTFALAAAQGGLNVGLLCGSESDSLGAGWADEPWDRRVYALGPASRSFLDSLRVWGSMDARRIAAVRDMRIYERGPERARLHFGAYEAGSDALAWIVEHRELTRAIDAALGFQQRVTRLTRAARAVQCDPQGAQIETDQGRLRSRLIVGADGSKSTVRSALQIASSVKPYEQCGVVANFAIEHSHRGVAHQWFLDEGVVALLPLAGNAVSLVWSAPDALARTLVEEGPIALAARLEALAGAILGHFASLGGVCSFPLSLLRTDALIATRCALMGDAAHVIHPLAGQGLNLGFGDARSLARVLIERGPGRDIGERVVLRRYERERAEAVWAMGQLTDQLQGLFASQNPALRRLRASGLTLVDHLPIVKQQLMRHAMS